MHRQFWVVIRDKPESYVSKRHTSREAANAEAERLCRKEQATFFVLEMMAYIEPREVPVIWHVMATQLDDGCPF